MGLSAVDLAVEAEVFDDLEVAVEGEFLGHVADAVFEFSALMPDVETGDVGVAAGRLKDSAEHFDGGGFAGAVGSEESVHGSGRDFEVDVVDGCEVAEAFDESGDFDGGLVGRERVFIDSFDDVEGVGFEVVFGLGFELGDEEVGE